MKALLFVTLCVFASLAWARPAENEGEEDALQTLGDIDLFDSIAKLHEMERTASALDELTPIFEALQKELEKIQEINDENTFNVCFVKLGITDNDTRDEDDLKNCLMECAAEESGMWKDGEPHGFLKAWKQFADIVIEKYSDIAEDIMDFCRAGQKCIKPAPKCMGFLPTMECLMESMPN